MSLRLLPALTLDNDDDDDGNFTKWMSSYWGHGAQGGHSKDRKRSFRRPVRFQTDRRGSLPTMSQLDAMSLSRLHAAAMVPSLSHVGPREEQQEQRPHPREEQQELRPHPGEEQQELRPHPRASRSSSDCRLISTIPEATLEQRLRSISLNEENRLCLICYEEMQKNGARTKQLHCTHHCHKEAQCRSERHKHMDQRRRSSDAHLHHQNPHQESHLHHHNPHQDPPLHRQLSLRRHR